MKQLLSILALGICATAHAGPSINVGAVYDYMDGNKSTYLKRVYNSGETTAFVRVQLYEITFDANNTPVETPLDTPDQAIVNRTGLIASPARLIIPPTGMQATRLLYRGDRDRERYYRLRFVPVLPEKEDQFDVSDSERETYKQSMSAGVNILAAYGTVFFVRPKDTRFDTQIHNSAQDYRVDNAGNSTIELNDFKDCAVAKPSDCLPIQKHILRPGKNFSFAKEPGRQYSFDLQEGDKSKTIEVEK